MKRLHAWLTGAAGGVAAYRLFRRRRDEVEETPPEAPPEPDPRAEELRAKLAETRTEEPEPVVETTADESPEERRRRVHEQARGALDEMQPPE